MGKACKAEEDVVAGVRGRDFRSLDRWVERNSLYKVPRKCIHDNKQKRYEDGPGVKRRLEEDTEELEEDTEERVLGGYDADYCTACANNWKKNRKACKAEEDVVAGYGGGTSAASTGGWSEIRSTKFPESASMTISKRD